MKVLIDSQYLKFYSIHDLFLLQSIVFEFLGYSNLPQLNSNLIRSDQGPGPSHQFLKERVFNYGTMLRPMRMGQIHRYVTPTRPNTIVLREDCERTLYRRSFVRRNRPVTLPLFLRCVKWYDSFP